MTDRRRSLRLLHLLLSAVLLISLAVVGLQACGGEQVVDQETVGKMEASDFRELASDASDSLIRHLGGDEAGFYAVILALDQGYDIYQILTGSLNDRVGSDGSITDSSGLPIAPARTGRDHRTGL